MIGSRLAAGALALVGLAVAWRAATIGLAGFVAGADPSLALKFDPDHADALVQQARAPLLEGDAASAEALARRALEARPLNAPAFRVLGLAAAERGDHGGADAMMARAVALSRRDPAAGSWMFGKAIDAGDHRQAFRHADALLRRSPDYGDTLFPRMIAAADEPAAADALARRLAHAPQWRPGFVALLAERGSEGAIRAVLGRVQASANPLSDLEMTWVLRRYQDRHHLGQVRGLWTELLPAHERRRLGLIYDGGFETRPGRQPFAWRTESERSVSAAFEPIAGAGGNALHVEHFGGSPERIISQTIALAPGRYRLSGRARSDAGGQADAMTWRVTCSGVRDPLGVARPDGSTSWQPFEVVFSVPDGCVAQVVSLESEPSGGGAISAWFDDLRIAPATGEEAAP